MSAMNLQMTMQVLDKASAPLKLLAANSSKLTASIGGNESKLAALNKSLADAAGWRASKKAIAGISSELESLNANNKKLATQLSVSKKKTDALSTSFEKAKKRIRGLCQRLKASPSHEANRWRNRRSQSQVRGS